jgi:hypothetical protein
MIRNTTKTLLNRQRPVRLTDLLTGIQPLITLRFGACLDVSTLFVADICLNFYRKGANGGSLCR